MKKKCINKAPETFTYPFTTIVSAVAADVTRRGVPGVDDAGDEVRTEKSALDVDSSELADSDGRLGVPGASAGAACEQDRTAR